MSYRSNPSLSSPLNTNFELGTVFFVLPPPRPSFLPHYSLPSFIEKMSARRRSQTLSTAPKKIAHLSTEPSTPSVVQSAATSASTAPAAPQPPKKTTKRQGQQGWKSASGGLAPIITLTHVSSPSTAVKPAPLPELPAKTSTSARRPQRQAKVDALAKKGTSDRRSAHGASLLTT